MRKNQSVDGAYKISSSPFQTPFLSQPPLPSPSGTLGCNIPRSLHHYSSTPSPQKPLSGTKTLRTTRYCRSRARCRQAQMETDKAFPLNSFSLLLCTAICLRLLPSKTVMKTAKQCMNDSSLLYEQEVSSWSSLPRAVSQKN